jgi:hypothetical protein
MKNALCYVLPCRHSCCSRYRIVVRAYGPRATRKSHAHHFPQERRGDRSDEEREAGEQVPSCSLLLMLARSSQSPQLAMVTTCQLMVEMAQLSWTYARTMTSSRWCGEMIFLHQMGNSLLWDRRSWSDRSVARTISSNGDTVRFELNERNGG